MAFAFLSRSNDLAQIVEDQREALALLGALDVAQERGRHEVVKGLVLAA